MTTPEYRPPNKRKKNTYANNSRCNEWMKEQGWVYWNTQAYNSFTFKKLDLFNLWDKLALVEHEGEGWIVGVQLTDHDHLKEHIRKMKANPYLEMWRRCGGGGLILYSVKEGNRWQVKQNWLY